LCRALSLDVDDGLEVTVGVLQVDEVVVVVDGGRGGGVRPIQRMKHLQSISFYAVVMLLAFITYHY